MFRFDHAKIAGVAITLGENRRFFDDEPHWYNSDPNLLKRLKKTIGFGTRFVANEATTTLDLGLDAAARILKALALEPHDIDAVISVTQTPDYYMPGNAHLLHEKLGLKKEAFALDVELGCSGFIYGLWLAFMTASNFQGRRILLVVGDTMSKVCSPLDRAEMPLFCDSAAAMIIERCEKPTASYFVLRSDGTGAKHLYQPAGAYRTRSSEATKEQKADKDGNVRSDENFYMNGFEVFNFTLREQPPLLEELLSFANATREEIDYFLIHQGNRYIVEMFARGAKLPPEKVPITFPDYGNQNGASIAGIICACLSEQLAEAKKEVVMQGFGIGLSYGACRLSLENVIALKPTIYGGNNES
ncbi:3-oxoacyl-ACP synthase [Campylobacterota bacterium]|nr:3-oxoacyl-ACP synthase [Campylobacterota bacterium]